MTAMTPALARPWSQVGEAIDAAATGIEIPPGDWPQINRAANTWAHTATALAAEARTVGAARVDWTGTAALGYLLATRLLAGELRRGAGVCRSAAVACKQHASALHRAQDEARAEIAAAKQALERIAAARTQIATAQTAAAAADRKALEAQTTADVARSAAGPLGELGAIQARQRELAARGEGSAARARAGRAQGLLDEAEHDLRRARARGREANRAAREAGRSAAQTLAQVAAESSVPSERFPPAAPVSPAGQPVGPLGELLQLVKPSTNGTKVSLGSATTDLKPSPLGAVGVANGVLGESLKLAAARAAQARREALAPVPTAGDGRNPLMRGPHAKANAERLRKVRDRAATRSPGGRRSPLKTGHGVLKKALPPLGVANNHRNGMPVIENAMRTAGSTFGAGAAGLGVVCGPAVVVCGPVLGYGGSKVGGVAGGAGYNLVKHAHQKVIVPLPGKVAKHLGKIGGRRWP
ncbi:MAG: hypothetical protein Q8O56_05245 [Solirubrobacteraceae bacterium]|nr:hypothetical protein [Solirubrobacteraceae bacterium]